MTYTLEIRVFTFYGEPLGRVTAGPNTRDGQCSSDQMWSNVPVLEQRMRRILSADVSVRWRRNKNAQIQQEALHHGHFSLKLNRAPDQQ